MGSHDVVQPPVLLQLIVLALLCACIGLSFIIAYQRDDLWTLRSKTALEHNSYVLWKSRTTCGCWSRPLPILPPDPPPIVETQLREAAPAYPFGRPMQPDCTPEAVL